MPYILILKSKCPLFFKDLFIYLFIFRERGGEGERGGEKHQCAVAFQVPSTGDLACNPGMCPHWKSNRRPCGSQASAQPTEPHQPELKSKCLLNTQDTKMNIRQHLYHFGSCKPSQKLNRVEQCGW